MKQKLWLLYFGRLTPEKGFDLVLTMLEYFLDKYWKILPFKIFIFGDGVLKDRLLDIAEQSEDIHYFGRRNLEEIKRYQDNYDYHLMPSKCLETFGLSALTACSRGLSVIGFAKGGQEQFIHPQYDLNTIKIKNNNTNKKTTDEHKLITMIEQILTSKKLPKNQNKAIAKNYTKQLRIKKIKAILWDKKKLLIINDFSEKKGGIETYIHDAIELLQAEGYEILFLGKNKTPKNILQKYFYLIMSIFNIKSYYTIKKTIQNFQPDTIWYHNIFRYHGRLSLLVAGEDSTAKKIIMYHDLGYFYPYPSQLEDEKQIIYPSSPYNFFKTITRKHPIKKIAGFFKGLRNLPTKQYIKKNITEHLVPSPFMEKIVHKSFNIKKKEIQTFSHFLQE